jgi:hypothetical protein
MKKLIMGLAIALGAVFLAYVAVFYALIELDEVVVLRTNDDQGEVFETRLWVADHAGHPWLVARFPDRRWLAHLQANPRVELLRAGSTRCHLAVVVQDDATRRELTPIFTQKYSRALAVALIPTRVRELVTSDPESAKPVLISLDPC